MTHQKSSSTASSSEVESLADSMKDLARSSMVEVEQLLVDFAKSLRVTKLESKEEFVESLKALGSTPSSFPDLMFSLIAFVLVCLRMSCSSFFFLFCTLSFFSSLLLQAMRLRSWRVAWT